VNNGQLRRPEAEALETGASATSDEVFQQGAPQTPEEAFGIQNEPDLDQAYLDELEQPPPRHRIWVAVGLAAAAAAVLAVVLATSGDGEPRDHQSTSAATVEPAPPVAEPSDKSEVEAALATGEPTEPPAVAHPEANDRPNGPTPTAAVAPTPAPPPVEPVAKAKTKTRLRARAEPAYGEPAAPAAANIGKTLSRAQGFYRKGKLKAAIEEFKKAIAADAGNDRAHTGLGTAYFDADQNSLAIQHLERALELNPRNGQALVILGNVHQAMGDNTHARQAYERYLAVEPSGKFADDVKLILQAM
jgi:Tfp pilus assembly protein PilF